MLSVKVTRKKRLDPAKFERATREFHESAAIVVEGDAKRRAPADLGRLRDSITHDANSQRAQVGTNLEYAAHVEYGTKPHFPPVAAIQEWAARVLGDSSRSTAFRIARAISIRGTKAKPFLRPALDNNRRNLRRLLRSIVGRVFSG